ncbi:right-handed parallel beta-helix repeat-containing protein [bacterium]|nr:right-handed parallel beta-helix repeat-containing protein [bacterium]
MHVTTLRLWPVAVLFLGDFIARGASTIYVDHRRGNDRRDGVSATVDGYHTGPVRTVQSALRRVAMGGRIVILPVSEPYTESFVVEGKRRLGSARRPLTIDGGGQEWVGWRPIPDEWTHRRGELFRLDRPTKTFTRLYQAGKPIAMSLDDPDQASGTLLAGQAARHETLLFFAGKNLRMPAEEDLWATSLPGGVVFDGASHVVLQNFIFRGYRIDAIQVRGVCRDITIKACEIHHSGRGGIYVGSCADVAVTQVSMSDLPKAGILAEDRARVRLRGVTTDGVANRISMGEDVVVDDDGKPADPRKTPSTSPTLLPPTEPLAEPDAPEIPSDLPLRPTPGRHR